MHLTQGLRRSLQLQPSAAAVCFGTRRRTFRELGARVARLAGALQALGMKVGDRVAMLALNSDRYLEYQLAVPWGGGVLNPCNTRWSPAEIAYSLQDSGTEILIIDDGFTSVAPQIQHQAKVVREVIHAGEGNAPAGLHGYEALIEASAPVEDADRGGSDLAGVFYTGGTTGYPKGVMLSHTNLIASAFMGLAQGLIAPDAVCLHAAPMFHLVDFALAQMAWLNGSRHCVIPKFDAEAVLMCIARERVTDMLLVPTMLQMLIDHPAMQAGHDFSSLARVTYAGSPISEMLLDRLMVAFPGVALTQGYGMTETAPMGTFLPAWHHTAEGRKAGKVRSAGRATYGTLVRIVNESDAELPRGTIGEITVKGPNVMLGYWNKPTETAAALRNGWMHTGDAGYMDEEGFIFVVDRLKDMIVSGGENVYSAEVENALAQHPAVAASAVIGVPDEQWGERVHAVIVCKPGTSATTQELITHCRQLIAGYKCPRSAEFCEVLPLSGAGKVLKSELRKPYWGGRPRQVS